MSRFEELRQILRDREYFKIVCGAGNEDADEVRKLSLVYTLAGALGIDVSANVDVVKNSVLGVNKAFELAPKLGKKLKTRPFINVSIGMRGDPHIRKAKIDADICSSCGSCLEYCLQKAITNDFQVIEKRCIGCGECGRVCPANAVSFFDKRNELKKILPDCLANGTETFELHAIIPDEESVMADWKLVNKFLADNYISMCLDRSQLSDTEVIRRIKAAYEITGERMIVQADGVPMSGGKDDYNTTLQTIAISDIVRKSNVPVMILASGGTNSKTGNLAKLCGVDINGVSIGTFARKLVADYINKDNFENDLDLIGKAVTVAEKLVKENLEDIRG
ncbi:MAG: LdpA C-terminal domain-containing domain [Candidatus Margulisiibacteriota bacterium]|nr:LdpA C-terminal domain-containing domain [Candidatus Margulisiibacteriota bacterium]